jgi:hypothetical protein
VQSQGGNPNERLASKAMNGLRHRAVPGQPVGSSPHGPLATGGPLDQCPYKTQEGLMLWAMAAVREEIRDLHA